LNTRAERAHKLRGTAWALCLGAGVLLLTAGRDLWAPACGLLFTATALFVRLRDPGRLRSLLRWMVPVPFFAGAYALLLHVSPAAGSPPSPAAAPLQSVARLLLRSAGMIFALFALEEALRPWALRARAGGAGRGRLAFMLGLSYQLVPVLSQSLQGVVLAQRAGAARWWLRPACVARAASSLLLLAHRLSEDLALALSLRLRPGGPPEETASPPGFRTRRKPADLADGAPGTRGSPKETTPQDPKGKDP